MNILVGATERSKDLESRAFFCPGCGSERMYLHHQSRQWLCLGVPLIPRAVTGDVYECQTCHREYDEHVITSPPTSDLATRVLRLTRAAVSLAVLDGDPYDHPTRIRALNVLRGAGLPHYSQTDLDADLRSIDVTRLDEEAEQLTIDLDVSGRERLVSDIGHVATATGEFSRANRLMLDRLGRSLEISPGVVHQILIRLDQEAAHIAAFAGDEHPSQTVAAGETPKPV